MFYLCPTNFEPVVVLQLFFATTNQLKVNVLPFNAVFEIATNANRGSTILLSGSWVQPIDIQKKIVRVIADKNQIFKRKPNWTFLYLLRQIASTWIFLDMGIKYSSRVYTYTDVAA